MARATRSTPRRPAPVPDTEPNALSPPLRRSAPELVLGRMEPNGIASSLYGLIERGAERRPRLARRMRGRVAIEFSDDHAPLAIVLEGTRIKVEDAPIANPDLLITGRLVDVVNFSTAPLWGGFPSIRRRRGRAALGALARGRLDMEGRTALARSLLRLIEV